MSSKRKIEGICRVCGEFKPLTREHIIPKSAGNIYDTPVFNGYDLVTHRNEPKKIKRTIKQGGFTVNTLCKQCNEKSGHWYDKDFSNFFMLLKQQLLPQIAVIGAGNLTDTLENKIVHFRIGPKIKPFNIAKRILVALCSAEHENMTKNRYPEIRKAILDKQYVPNVSKFSIYIGLNLSNQLVFPLQVALVNGVKGVIHESYAGVESDVLSMYLAPHNEHEQGGNLLRCLDITPWLTRYSYDEQKTLELELMFNKSLSLRYPIPE